jgi:methyl-accepting chemotaxis protein
MKWFLDLTTRSKLFAGFGLMIVLLASVVATAYLGISAIQESQKNLYEEDFANERDLLALRVNYNGMRALMLEAQLLSKRAEQDPLLAEAAERSKRIDRIILTLLERAKNDPNRLSRLEELKSVWQAFAQTKDAEIIPLILAGKIAESRELAVGVQQGRAQKIRAIDEELGKATEENARRAVAESEQRTRQSMQLFLIIAIAAILLAVAMVLFLNRIIAVPLGVISGIAGQVAAGDLTVNVPEVDRADEVGALVRAFRAMLENLRGQIRGLIEGANVLGSAASEIVASTTQLAASASESAAAVSETTTTVEEVRQTAQVASQKAKYVSESAQKAAQISQSGRKSTEDVVAGINRIRQQMEAIAASMVRLSEQSQAIGQIMASVEDLAAQSNLLAVNAAIEAAKAGEHGKGFGVVAQEVKSLAEQSRQATNQVRTILSDIQKATAAAVMATEQGSKAVEAGTRQTEVAGEAIQALAGSVTEAAQAATQIAASSQQQLVGVDQVAAAMESIKQASTQNVASAQQLENAARNLNELGQKLKQLVERYRV